MNEKLAELEKHSILPLEVQNIILLFKTTFYRLIENLLLQKFLKYYLNVSIFE